MSWKDALTMTCSSLERGVVEVFQHRQVYLLCVGTESPSQSGRGHGTPTWCVVPESGRVPEVHEARGTLTGTAMPMRSSDSSGLLNSFPPNTPIPGIVPLLEALSSSLGIITSGRGRPITPSPRGTCTQRSRLFPDYPRKPGRPKWGVEPELLRQDLVRSAPYQTTTSSHSPSRIVMRLTRSSNREFSWLNRASQHVIMMTSETTIFSTSHIRHANAPCQTLERSKNGKA